MWGYIIGGGIFVFGIGAMLIIAWGAGTNAKNFKHDEED